MLNDPKLQLKLVRLARAIADLPRSTKRLILITVDFLGLAFLTVFAIWLRLGKTTLPDSDFLPAIVLMPVVAIVIFTLHGLYRAVVRYIGFHFAATVFISVTLMAIVWAASIFMLDLRFPRSAIVITWLLALLYIAGTRLIARWLLVDGIVRSGPFSPKQVVIIGAGASGQQLMSAISKIPSYKVVAFIDDDKQLHKQEIASLRVHRRRDLDKLIDHYGVSEVFLAMPSISASKRRQILEWLEPYSVKVSTLPSLDQIVEGKVSFSDIREVNIEDLLGRDSVPPDPTLLARCIYDQVVMITGAGGSIGAELCRQVIRQRPRLLILYELSEFALYNIEQELLHGEDRSDTHIISMLGNVTNNTKLERLISGYRVDTIYHAAAYKHVPMVEHNVYEGLVNNTFGTHQTAKIAAKCGVKNFVLVSTDKAVRPTNIMGASKRLAEMSLQALQVAYPETTFAMVRFGNVLDSSGSVIPLFRKQIENGGPVTVTHKAITRYFMTIPEAASLVIQAGSMATGGDVFVLDMGEPVKIDDLAKTVIKLSGLQVADEHGEGDIEIVYTGLRPGEKLYEELLVGEAVDGTDHPRIMKAHEAFEKYTTLQQAFADIQVNLDKHHYAAILEQLHELIPGFNHTCGVQDYLADDVMPVSRPKDRNLKAVDVQALNE